MASAESMLESQNAGFGFAQENTPGGGKSWWDTAVDAASAVSQPFAAAAGQATGKKAGDWLTAAMGEQEQEEQARRTTRFQNPNAMQRAGQSVVERDKNVGAQPGSPRTQYQAAGGNGQDGSGGAPLGGLLDSQTGKLLVGAGVALAVYAMTR